MFNVSVRCVLKDNQLMCNDPIGYLFLFFLIELESFRNFMHFLFASILNFVVAIENCSYIKLFFAAGVLVIGTEGSI